MCLQIKAQAEENFKKDIDVSLEDVNYFDMNILTDSDWQSYKVLFEQSYPNYLQKFRNQFPDISPAVERLFLFIKLKISTKEAANIL